MIRKWLDRERRLFSLATLLRHKRKEAEMWFRHYQKALGERARLLAELEVTEETLTDESTRADRYRLAWESARGRAQRRGDEIGRLRQQLRAADHRIDSLNGAVSRLGELNAQLHHKYEGVPS